ncbi:Polyphosphate kinase 2 [compost metagenome]
MDIKSYNRWDDYTRARDEMFEATDVEWAPWYVARSENKKAVRLNLITHLLEQIPYETIKQPKIKLPKRKVGDYETINYPFKYIAEPFQASVSEE